MGKGEERIGEKRRGRRREGRRETKEDWKKIEEGDRNEKKGSEKC